MELKIFNNEFFNLRKKIITFELENLPFSASQVKNVIAIEKGYPPDNSQNAVLHAIFR